MSKPPPALDIAANILKRAVSADESKNYAQSLLYYQEGIEILLKIIKDDATDAGCKAKLHKNAASYMDRAEEIKRLLEKEKTSSSYHEQFKITDGDTGYSYNRVFSPYCDSSLTSVEVDDPYVRESYQLYNFVRFCELFVKLRCPLKTIILNTHLQETANQNGQQLQPSAFNDLSQSLAKHGGIVLEVKHSETLHDREVRFNNGWIFKLGRGLSYFKKPEFGIFCIGSCDMDLRPCHETTIDIFHRSSLGGKNN